jgi:type I restriction enzyme R subunit
MSKKDLNETEICQNFITPAIVQSGWDQYTQVRREFAFTAGRVIVRGKIAVRGKQKRADYLLFFESNLPLAVVEAKDNNQPVGGGMPQALAYAETLDVPFVFSSNGDGFLFHDRTDARHQSRRRSPSTSFLRPRPSGHVTGRGRASRTRPRRSSGFHTTRTPPAGNCATTSASQSSAPSRP